MSGEKTSLPLYKTLLVKVERLILDEANPRYIEDDKFQALKRSMSKDKDFIKVRPIIANAHEGREFVVVGGNQRLRAAKDLGMTEVPVIFVDLPKNKEAEWNLKDNIPAGSWDLNKLSKILTQLHEDEYDLSGIGFSGGELESFMQLDESPIDSSDDPDYNGTTPAKEVECPECGHKFVPSRKRGGK